MTTMREGPLAPNAPLDPDETTTAKMLPSGTARYLWALTRLCLGWIFLWPFLDKTFGLHHQTPSAKAWIHGG